MIFDTLTPKKPNELSFYCYERDVRQAYAYLKLEGYFKCLTKKQRLELANNLGGTNPDGTSKLKIVEHAGMLMEENIETGEKDYNMYCVLTNRAEYEVFKQIMESVLKELRTREAHGEKPIVMLRKSPEIRRMFPKGFEYVRSWMNENQKYYLPCTQI